MVVIVMVFAIISIAHCNIVLFKLIAEILECVSITKKWWEGECNVTIPIEIKRKVIINWIYPFFRGGMAVLRIDL